MATLSPESAQRIAELKEKRAEALKSADDIFKSPEYIQANSQLVPLEKEKNLALLAFRNASVSESSAAKAVYDSIQATYAANYKIWSTLSSQALDYKIQADSYQIDIQNVAAVQTTSPAPTLAEQEDEAKKAGAAAAALPTPVPAEPVEPQLLSPEEINTQYVPTLQTVVVRSSAPEIGEIEDVQLPPDNQQITQSYISDIDADIAAANTPSTQLPGRSYAQSIAAIEEGYPPEVQEVVTDEVKLLDLTAGGEDQLGDFITQLQSGGRQQNSLPNRNQQSGTGSPKDWRFRMSLAPSANYLYKSATPGILKPLQATSGVIFPYSPQINVSYTAAYSTADLVHTNYKIYNYKNSSVENISITADFTCQDSAEANYVLAVIHFFKSVTKMFYGQDQSPIRGTPPPLVYLTGFGQYQFDMHPVVITSFTHSFPADVDYVNAYPTNNSSSIGGQNMAPYMPQIAQFISPLDRLRTLSSKIAPGGRAPPPTFVTSQNINEVTRVPAKITLQLSCLPIITRKAMSNSFSLQKYASGELMRGSVNFNNTGGGIW